MRHTAMLLLTLCLTACMDDVIVIPPITTSGAPTTSTSTTGTTGDPSTTGAESTSGGDGWCPAAEACLFGDDPASCAACANECPGEAAACKDYAACRQVVNPLTKVPYSQCECSEGGCATMAWPISCGACADACAASQICG